MPANIDNVSVRELLGYTNKASTDIAIIVSAPATESKTVVCADRGLAAGCVVTSVNGAVQTLPTTLLAGESRLFVKP